MTAEPVYITTEDEIFTLDDKRVSWRDLNLDPPKYYVIKGEAELEQLRAEKKFRVPFKGGDAEAIKSEAKAKTKDDPGELGEWLEVAKKKKKQKEGQKSC
jgi:hypothetical protein